MCIEIQQTSTNTTDDDEVEKVTHHTKRIFELGDEVFEKVENVMNAFFRMNVWVNIVKWLKRYAYVFILYIYIYILIL